jgi:hypothetical protein
MDIRDLPFGTTNWTEVPATEHPGTTGRALWRTRQFGAIRVDGRIFTRLSCRPLVQQGHILLCLTGELQTELADGRVFTLTPGMSYQVADGAEPHRSRTTTGATLFIVD